MTDEKTQTDEGLLGPGGIAPSALKLGPVEFLRDLHRENPQITPDGYGLTAPDYQARIGAWLAAHDHRSAQTTTYGHEGVTIASQTGFDAPPREDRQSGGDFG